MNEFYPATRAEEKITLRSKQMLIVSLAALAADGIIFYDTHVEEQKEVVQITHPECVDFMSRDDFFDTSHADACTDELRIGKVALIDLRGPEAIPSADELARIVSDEMTYDSAGYLTPRIETVGVSSDVVDAIEDYTCDPSKNGTADNVAYYQAEQLRDQGYDKAVVLTPLTLCEEPLLGYAESTRDIATVGQASSMREDELVRVTQHELAHLYGIGHSGILRGDEFNDLVLYEFMYDDPRYETSIDLAELVQNAQREEYGDSPSYSTQYSGALGAIMGTPTPGDKLKDGFSDYQLQLLSASRNLPTQNNADYGPVTLEPAMLKIDAPIVTKVGSIDTEGFEQYDRVVVSPQMHSGMRWNSAEISLGDAGGNSLLLGRIYLKDDGEEGQMVPLNQKYTLVGSEAAVRVAFDNGTITVEKLGL